MLDLLVDKHPHIRASKRVWGFLLRSMTRQPYIYTMPEGFMKDHSVPVKWRLYGVINGFWISGKQVYASSPFFAEKLECTVRHIRRALEELEKEGYLKREIKGNSRIILPNAQIVEEDMGGPTGGHLASYKEDVGGPHISISNSDSLLSKNLSSDSEVVVLPDVEEGARPKRQKVSVSAAHEWISVWNRYPDWKTLGKRGTPPNPTVLKQLLPRAEPTADVNGAIVRRRSKYTVPEFEKAVKSYATEICNRDKKDSYSQHRYSLYDFLVRKEVLERYVNR